MTLKNQLLIYMSENLEVSYEGFLLNMYKPYLWSNNRKGKYLKWSCNLNNIKHLPNYETYKRTVSKLLSEKK